ncbi:MAG: DUF3422 domain-containing protein [Pseudomonadota bacterium]
MKLPENHEQRFDLSNEVHARPPEPLTAPVKVSCIAVTTDWPYREEDRDVVAQLTKRYGKTPPGPGVKHYSVDLGAFRLIWERHTEFTRYTFITSATDDFFSTSAIESAPTEWIESLPGNLIAAANAVFVQDEEATDDYSALSDRYFDGNALIGSIVTSDAAVAVTDFRIHSDGFSRFLVYNRSMTPWHAGRIVQRLLEIETYRIMALLSLPEAHKLNPQLSAWETKLSDITMKMTRTTDTEEQELLNSLTSLQADIEQSHTQSQFRFNAGKAYYALVQRRIEELREERIKGMQTFSEFTERRLAPAMNTCTAAANRLHSLSERVDRSAQLLSTRVNMSLERQNQAVLEHMNRRAELQIRLQQTVEGLSIAAITYYAVGVVGYIGYALEESGLAINTKIVMGIAVPIVLLLSALGVWHMRKMVAERDQQFGESGSQ